MEVGPGYFGPGNPPRPLYFSDEERIFEVVQIGPGELATVRSLVDVRGRRWSGLAFDTAGNFFFMDHGLGEVFVLPASDMAEPITNEAALAERAYVIKAGLDSPRDIEISADEDRYWISTADGIESFFMPVVGREGPDIRTIRAKTQSKEYDVTRRGPVFNNDFIVNSIHDDLIDYSIRLLVERRDPVTNQYSWEEVEVEFATAGITILDGEL